MFVSVQSFVKKKLSRCLRFMQVADLEIIISVTSLGSFHTLDLLQVPHANPEEQPLLKPFVTSEGCSSSPSLPWKLLGGFNRFGKIFVKLDHFPKVRGESKRDLKPPPRKWFRKSLHQTLKKSAFPKQLQNSKTVNESKSTIIPSPILSLYTPGKLTWNSWTLKMNPFVSEALGFPSFSGSSRQFSGRMAACLSRAPCSAFCNCKFAPTSISCFRAFTYPRQQSLSKHQHTLFFPNINKLFGFFLRDLKISTVSITISLSPWKQRSLKACPTAAASWAGVSPSL